MSGASLEGAAALPDGELNAGDVSRLVAAARQVVELHVRFCGECDEDDPPRRTVATHRKSFMGLEIENLCAAHAEQYEAIIKRAESKGSRRGTDRAIPSKQAAELLELLCALEALEAFR